MAVEKVDDKTYIKRMRRFCVGLYGLVFNVLGWVLVSEMHSSKYIWVVTVPIMFLCTLQGVFALVAWIYADE